MFHGFFNSLLDTAAGVNALFRNTTGQQNTAVGTHAMFQNTTGNNNTALGYQAGWGLTTGSNDVDIGNLGVAAESNTIRIGTQGTQNATYIAGVFGSSVTGDAVVVSNTGKLGIVVSSARYKHDIRDMGTSSEALMKLRPVTFLYTNDPSQQRQYGLVAEEVGRVYPDLVSRDADGRVVSVYYHELVPMLLNEVQKQAQQIRRLNAKVAEDQAERASFEQRLAVERAERGSFEQRLAVLVRNLAARSQDETLAAALGR
jgi:hypothetical protein